MGADGGEMNLFGDRIPTGVWIGGWVGTEYFSSLAACMNSQCHLLYQTVCRKCGEGKITSPSGLFVSAFTVNRNERLLFFLLTSELEQLLSKQCFGDNEIEWYRWMKMKWVWLLPSVILNWWMGFNQHHIAVDTSGGNCMQWFSRREKGPIYSPSQCEWRDWIIF